MIEKSANTLAFIIESLQPISHTQSVSVCVRGTNRSTGAAWPLLLLASAGGRSAAVCPVGPEPPDSLGAGSPTG